MPRLYDPNKDGDPVKYSMNAWKKDIPDWRNAEAKAASRGVTVRLIVAVVVFLIVFVLGVVSLRDVLDITLTCTLAIFASFAAIITFISS